MKKILIIGGAGFIGSHVNKCLSQAGYSTLVYDNLSRGDRESVLYGDLVVGDIGNIQDLEKVFTQHKFDAVMHFAAYINVGESVKNPALYYKNNVCNTMNILETMLKHNCKTLIFSSSAAVYGNPSTPLISEDHPLNPINPYGRTKLIIENLLKDYGHAFGLKSSSLRYFNAAGGDPEGEIKNQKKQEMNLIPIILKSLKDNKIVEIFGTDYDTVDGTCVRDYIHVADIATAHKLALEKTIQSNMSSTYNLGNGRGYSVKQVVRAIEYVTKLNVNVVNSAKREGDPAFLVANSEKAQKELKWKTNFPEIEQIVRDAWKAIEK
jgi:UDP-glucose 4-epimerase